VYCKLPEVSVVDARIMPSEKNTPKGKRRQYFLDIQFRCVYVWPSNIGQGAAEVTGIDLEYHVVSTL